MFLRTGEYPSETNKGLKDAFKRVGIGLTFTVSFIGCIFRLVRGFELVRPINYFRTSRGRVATDKLGQFSEGCDFWGQILQSSH